MKRKWLEHFDWENVTLLNEALCMEKNALHKPTSDGHDVTRQLWEANYQKEMKLEEAIELCRRCHRSAPFCFYNGNTFVAIIRLGVNDLEIDEVRKSQMRFLAGNTVAGTVTREETRQLNKLASQVEQPKKSKRNSP